MGSSHGGSYYIPSHKLKIESYNFIFPNILVGFTILIPINALSQLYCITYQ